MGSDLDDVRTRLRDSLTRAADSAYAAAKGSDRLPEPLAVRWHLDVRTARLLALAVLVCAAVGWIALRPASTPPTTISVVSASADPGLAVLVHVTGAVVHPGLVTLEQGARVADAVEAAGGLTAVADESGVNLARLVHDGEQVFVPTFGEEGDSLVNINRADATDLDSLPGIGPVLADRIVADREAHGPFVSVDDLGRVSGIGQALLGGLAGLATV